MLVDYFESSEFIHIKLPTTESIKKMPLEQFDGEQIYDDDPLIKLEKGSLRGFSKYRDLNIGTEISEPEWRDCEILFYDQLNKRFTIKWLCNGKKKEVTRLNLLFEFESQFRGDNRFKQALQHREEMITYLNFRTQI